MLKWLKRLVGLGWRTDDEDEGTTLSHPSPDPAGLFYHVRRLGDRRPPATGLPRCTASGCARLFEPTRSRIGDPQTVCEACLQVAEEKVQAKAARLLRLRKARAERKARKGHPVLVGEKGKSRVTRASESRVRALGPQGTEVVAAMIAAPEHTSAGGA